MKWVSRHPAVDLIILVSRSLVCIVVTGVLQLPKVAGVVHADADGAAVDCLLLT